MSPHVKYVASSWGCIHDYGTWMTNPYVLQIFKIHFVFVVLRLSNLYLFHWQYPYPNTLKFCTIAAGECGVAFIHNSQNWFLIII